MPTLASSSASYLPQKESIGALLSLTSPSIIVPEWQRNYRWERGHIESFWTDIEKFRKRAGKNPAADYFLGSVVIVRTTNGSLLLLDGQQRLATSAILLSSIRDRVTEFRPEAGKQIQDQFLVGHDYVNDVVVHKLRLNIYDREFFSRLVLDWRDQSFQEPEPAIASHRLILSARRYFDERLDELGKNAHPKDQYDQYMELSRTLLNQVSLIAIYSHDENSAADVFETLNDRGIGLSTPDLLRNLIMRRAKDGQQDEIVKSWESVVSFESDARIEGFLRHFWVSKYGDVKSRSLYREIKDEIEEKDLDTKRLAQQLSDAAETYRKLLDSDTNSAKMNRLLSEISEFGRSSNLLYPVILGIVEELEESEALTCVSALLNLFVRYAVISQTENSKLENVIYSAIRELRQTRSSRQFLADLEKYSPTDDEVIERFKSLSIVHNGTRKNILRRIEMQMRSTKELEVSDSTNVHVEHIYPMKPKAGKAWPEHDKYINRIGNLTLLSSTINISLKNSEFEQKKHRFAESEVVMTRKLAALKDWKPNNVEKRQQEFASLAVKCWPRSTKETK